MPKTTQRLSNNSRVIILGAGPAGLGAAYRLGELGYQDFTLYEQSNHVGGLAASFVDERGFTWDIGGHVQFSHYRYFDELMHKALGGNWLYHERESWVWLENRFVPYPFQNNIRHLSIESRWKCIKGLIELYRNPKAGRPKNFGEWIDATFGAGLAEIFMRPYNFKVWAHPPEEMSFEWVGERVAVTDLERVLFNVMHEKDDLSWGPNNTFQFPEYGGTGAIWEKVANLVGRQHIKLKLGANRIDSTAKRIYLSDGSTVNYDVLVSTIPVDDLVRIAGLSHLEVHTKQLKFSSSNIIGIGLSGRPPAALTKKCWMYFPENDCPFYRVTVFSNYSPNNVPDISKYWSLMAEVSESGHKPVNQETLIADTIQGMRNTRLIDDSHSVVSTWKYRAYHGYPTPTIGRDAALNGLHAELEALGIFSRGRFGGWKYEVSNQDHTMMQGVELINRLAVDVPEVTYYFPNTANDMRYAK
jgi:protoporphyrinogen oxidase